MSRLGSFTHTSDEKKRYTISYSDWLLEGETISSVTTSIDNVTTPPLEVEDPSDTDTMFIFFVSGGEDTERYKVTVEVTTSLGQIKEDYVQYVINDI